MIKRQFYKQEHDNQGDDLSDTSSSGSEVEEEEEVSDTQQEDEEEEDIEAVAEAKDDDVQPISLSPGLLLDDDDNDEDGDDEDDDDDEEDDDDDDGVKNARKKLNGKTYNSARKDSIEADYAGRVLQCGSVFKCRLCPRIVCLSAETLRAHLVSKRHARSEKLLNEGRLKFMLNNDGEVEEDQETHAERHARTLAIAQDLTYVKKKNRGRQRQRLRLKRKKMGDDSAEVKNDDSDKVKKKKQSVKHQAENGSDKVKEKQSVKNQAKKRRKNKD